jgi:hypothetical protein
MFEINAKRMRYPDLGCDGLKILPGVEVVIRPDLNHQNADHILFGIDPEISAKCATPSIADDRAQVRRFAHIRQHAVAETEAVADGDVAVGRLAAKASWLSRMLSRIFMAILSPPHVW